MPLELYENPWIKTEWKRNSKMNQNFPDLGVQQECQESLRNLDVTLYLKIAK